MTRKNPEIKTREDFCEFLQEILRELRDHSPNWYLDMISKFRTVAMLFSNS